MMLEKKKNLKIDVVPIVSEDTPMARVPHSTKHRKSVLTPIAGKEMKQKVAPAPFVDIKGEIALRSKKNDE